MKRLCRGLLCVFLLGGAAGFLDAAADTKIVVRLRLYEGFKERGKVSAVVVSSYYLKKLDREKIFSDVESSKEKEALKKIYNLQEVKNISSLDMILKKGSRKTRSQEIVLGGRELAVRLSAIVRDKNRFKVEVLEKGKRAASLMDTEIIMPQEKTAVLGFEDAAGRIYFLSFHREKDRSSGETKPVARIQSPRLVKIVEPLYPGRALEDRLEGEVIIEAVMNREGGLEQLHVVKGEHPVLNGAAVEAVKQWKYIPLKVNGTARETGVTVKIVFNLEEVLREGGR